MIFSYVNSDNIYTICKISYLKNNKAILKITYYTPVFDMIKDILKFKFRYRQSHECEIVKMSDSWIGNISPELKTTIKEIIEKNDTNKILSR